MVSYPRIIARLDIKGPNLVKGIHLEGLRVLGTPSEFAKKYFDDGADELFYQDVVASLYNRNSILKFISQTAETISIPLTVGGGIRKISDIKNALNLFREREASLVMSAAISRKNPYFNQVYQTTNSVKLVKKSKSNYKRRQDTPIIYDLNASIYVYKRNVLIKSNTIYVNKSFLYVMPQNRSFDIDSKSDFDYVKFLMKKKNQ